MMYFMQMLMEDSLHTDTWCVCKEQVLGVLNLEQVINVLHIFFPHIQFIKITIDNSD